LRRKLTDWAKSELKKKPEKRGLLWVSVLTLTLICDELLKEGYLFNPKEVAQPLTHEFFVTLIWGAYVILISVLQIGRRRARKVD